MNQLTIVTALQKLGFDGGWAANDVAGIILWERPEPQPSDKELKQAGWISAEPLEENNLK